jgi:hypothetical protein
MSLINDALKRAKQVQQEAPPPPAPNLELRPVEPAQCTRQSFGLLVPAALAVVALLLLLFVWQRAQQPGSAQPTEVHARVAMPATPTAARPPDPAPAAPAPAAQPVPDAPPPPPMEAVADPATVVEQAAVALPADPPALAAAGSEVTNAPVVTEAPPPKASLPKLQGIVFSPTRPSVMLNGKTLFIGEKLNGLRVTAIDKESVTLVGAGQTNVLTLAE